MTIIKTKIKEINEVIKPKGLRVYCFYGKTKTFKVALYKNKKNREVLSGNQPTKKEVCNINSDSIEILDSKYLDDVTTEYLKGYVEFVKSINT